MSRTSHLPSPACPPPDPLSWSLVFSDPGFSSQRIVGLWVCSTTTRPSHCLKGDSFCQHHWAVGAPILGLARHSMSSTTVTHQQIFAEWTSGSNPSCEITGSETSEGLFYLSAPGALLSSYMGYERVCV